MKTIALAAAAFLVATGTAFAGSDHYGSDGVNQPAAPLANVDNTFTASIRKPLTAEYNAVNTSVTTQSGPAESGQGIWATISLQTPEHKERRARPAALCSDCRQIPSNFGGVFALCD